MGKTIINHPEKGLYIIVLLPQVVIDYVVDHFIYDIDGKLRARQIYSDKTHIRMIQDDYCLRSDNHSSETRDINTQH